MFKSTIENSKSAFDDEKMGVDSSDEEEAVPKPKKAKESLSRLGDIQESEDGMFIVNSIRSSY